MNADPTVPPPVAVLIADHLGLLAVSDGIVYYLTPCCRASVTGTTDGTACRACYTLVDPRLGDAWLVDDKAAWTRWTKAWLRRVSDDPGQQWIGRHVAVLTRRAARQHPVG